MYGQICHRQTFLSVGDNSVTHEKHTSRHMNKYDYCEYATAVKRMLHMTGKRCSYCLLKCVSGKWKMEILCSLKDGELRMSELEHRVPEANPRVLARQLRCLEKDGIVERKIYAEVPPKVEYSLTEYGKAMMKLFKMVNEFTIEHLEILKK